MPAGTHRPRAARRLAAPFDEALDVEPYPFYLNDTPQRFAQSALSGTLTSLDVNDPDLTWEQIVPVYNDLVATQDSGEKPLHVDGEGRAYELTTYNPDSKWDWYSIGGRWSGHFLARTDLTAEQHRQLINPQEEDDESDDPGMRCDGGPVGLLDLAGMRTKGRHAATAAYDTWTSVVAGTPPVRDWAGFQERHLADPTGYPIRTAREDFFDQPRIKAVQAHDAAHPAEALGGWSGVTDVVEEFQLGHRDYLDLCTGQAVLGHALLRLDRQWVEPGRMGWFGVSTDTAADRLEYTRAATAYLDDLGPHTVLVSVDCHI